MSAFFHGWRRKAGFVTLAMACALAVGWMRSGPVHDVCVFQVGDMTHEIYSRHHMIYWTRIEDSRRPGVYFEQWLTYPCGKDDILTDPRRGSYVDCLQTPYFFLVFPLTLLSAWLLLSKPRQSPKPTTGA